MTTFIVAVALLTFDDPTSKGLAAPFRLKSCLRLVRF